jgi:hypothetical protein
MQWRSSERRQAWADYSAGWTRWRKAELALLPLAVFGAIGVMGFGMGMLFHGRLPEGVAVLAAGLALYWTLFRRLRRRFPRP